MLGEAGAGAGLPIAKSSGTIFTSTLAILEPSNTHKNHGKSWKIMVIIIMAFFGHFMVILGLNNIFNGFIYFFRSGLV